ncbi:hypothetical protein LEP1GSC171_1030 [Leptospira santarosai str. HAI1380]|nr:hypothetical protein LEP1GSC171_1030 [Leptospira santarosai str. HAI1380]
MEPPSIEIRLFSLRERFLGVKIRSNWKRTSEIKAAFDSKNLK